MTVVSCRFDRRCLGCWALCSLKRLEAAGFQMLNTVQLAEKFQKGSWTCSRGSGGVPTLCICNSRNAEYGIDLESLDTAPRSIPVNATDKDWISRSFWQFIFLKISDKKDQRNNQRPVPLSNHVGRRTFKENLDPGTNFTWYHEHFPKKDPILAWSSQSRSSRVDEFEPCPALWCGCKKLLSQRLKWPFWDNFREQKNTVHFFH